MLNNKIFILFFITFLLSFQGVKANEDNNAITTIQEVSDLDALFKQSKRENKVIMLEMSASDCSYCRKLEAEILNPMIISGEYENVLIRHIEIDGYDDIKMPNGQTMSPYEYAHSKNVFVTPTLLFLNSKNEEVAKRIIGINSVDYFGAYVDDALEIGASKL